MAFRHYCTSRLQPVPGRNLWNGIRSECNGFHTSGVYAFYRGSSTNFNRENADLEMRHDMPLPGRQLITTWCAGASAHLHCSLCKAGTYLTGLGVCGNVLTLQGHCLPASCGADGVTCRRHCSCQLQPVPGRDVWDRIRSLCNLCFSALVVHERY
jgi:hypothetical protein